MSNGVVVVPSYLVAADVQIRVAVPPVRQPVDELRVAVEVEDHRLVGGEQRVR